MNRSILMSLMAIAFVGATVGGTTLAVFQDTESAEAAFEAAKFGIQTTWERSFNGQSLEPIYEGESTPIFDFDDVKPGDNGSATAALQLENSSGYVWLSVNQTSNLETNCTEPENVIENGCGSKGELGDYLIFTVWSDDGDNQLEDGENILFEGTAHELSEESAFPEGLLLDGNYSTEEIEPFSANETSYVGIKWELPFETGNIVQADLKSFDFRFYTEQENDTLEPSEEDTKAISFVAFCEEAQAGQKSGQKPSNPCPEAQEPAAKFELQGTSFEPEEDAEGISLNATKFKEDQTEPIEAEWSSKREMEATVVKAGQQLCDYPGGKHGTVKSCGE